jgi:membrane-associated phospholipid phosphatase
MIKSSLITLFTLVLATQAHAKTGWQKFADIGAYGLPLAALGLTAANDDLNEGGYQLAYTGAAATVTTQSLKYLINAKRPNGGDKGFPSGHTTTAFFAAAYLENRYGWEVGIPAHLLAGAVGYARVKSKNHNWGQVVAGAAIGEVSAYLFTTRIDDNVRFYPWQDAETGATGIAMVANF